jgi:hypothetical protein
MESRSSLALRQAEVEIEALDSLALCTATERSKNVELESDANAIAIALGTADLLWHREECASILSPPDAGLPGVPVDRGVHRSATPAMGDRRRVLVGHRGEVPATLARIAE